MAECTTWLIEDGNLIIDDGYLILCEEVVSTGGISLRDHPRTVVSFLPPRQVFDEDDERKREVDEIIALLMLTDEL